MIPIQLAIIKDYHLPRQMQHCYLDFGWTTVVTAGFSPRVHRTNITYFIITFNIRKLSTRHYSLLYFKTDSYTEAELNVTYILRPLHY